MMVIASKVHLTAVAVTERILDKEKKNEGNEGIDMKKRRSRRKEG
jgi:hypothetical protein